MRSMRRVSLTWINRTGSSTTWAAIEKLFQRYAARVRRLLRVIVRCQSSVIQDRWSDKKKWGFPFRGTGSSNCDLSWGSCFPSLCDRHHRTANRDPVKLFHSSEATKQYRRADEAIFLFHENTQKQTAGIVSPDQPTEVPMTKHRTITGFVVVALLAVTTAANVRSHSRSTELPIASAGMVSFKERTADVNRLPTEDFDDQSLVYSTGTKR
jgi:hypothetical protein